MVSRRLLREKIVKSLYGYLKTEGESVRTSQKVLLFSVEKSYDLYHMFFDLIVEVSRLAENRIELGRNKLLPTAEDLNPNTKFVNNEVVASIAENKKLYSYLDDKKLNWSNYPDLIKRLYTEMTGSDYYKEYMSSSKRGYNEDKLFVLQFFGTHIDDNQYLADILEEQSIFWADDIEFVLGMVIRTIDASKRDSKIRLMNFYKSDDDKEYAIRLHSRAIRQHKEYLEYIDTFIENWDVERVAFMDFVIMTAAIAELEEFDNIPVKVTLDEYIEIAKCYSTPSSGMFINGILDKVISDLVAKGRIQKAGRGLVETRL